VTAPQIAQLAVILAPIAKELVVEGGKLVATMRDEISVEDLTRSLELSKSASWPALDFKAGA